MVDVAICRGRAEVHSSFSDSFNLRTEGIHVEAIDLLHAEQTGFHGEGDQRPSRAANFVRPFALLLFVVPEELMRTLTHVVRTRLTHVVDIAVLFMRIGSIQSNETIKR